jgi:predicted esterase
MHFRSLLPLLPAIATLLLPPLRGADEKPTPDPRSLSWYFDVREGLHPMGPAAVAAHAFAICELTVHVINQAEPPAAAWRDATRVAEYFPNGYTLTAAFVDARGRPVARLDEPGVYGADITVASGSWTHHVPRILVRLPDGAPLPEDRSEVAAFRLLAEQVLGRPWTATDPSLYTFGDQWWWAAQRAAGTARPHDYFVVYPPGFSRADDPKRKLPTFVYLHGSGARRYDIGQIQADAFYDSVRPHTARGVLLVVPLSKGPWLPGALGDLLDRVLAEQPVDPDRLYVGGHSMGGTGTWMAIDALGERIAAAVPVAGGGVPHLERAVRLARVPVWAVFGENDNPDGQARTAAMIEAISAAGGEARYTVLPGADHMRSRNEFFARTDLFDWLLAHRRPGAAPASAP